MQSTTETLYIINDPPPQLTPNNKLNSVLHDVTINMHIISMNVWITLKQSSILCISPVYCTIKCDISNLLWIRPLIKVKPVYNRHSWNFYILSTSDRCPLHPGLIDRVYSEHNPLKSGYSIQSRCLFRQVLPYLIQQWEDLYYRQCSSTTS